jgi:glycosyltransferase involved in cell wall biosynthesis
MKVANILFNHKSSSTETKAFGVERCFIDYSKYLISYNAEVLSVFKNGITYLDEIKETKSEILQIEALNALDITSIFRLTVSFYKFKPDVAICHSGRALYFTRVARFFSLKNFPIIAINHGSNIKKFLKADYILSVNSYSANAIIKAGKSKDRSLVIPNMMEIPKDFKKITKPAFRKPIRLGSLGRVASEKSFKSVLGAMAILRERGIESEFYLGGTGAEEENLKKLSRDINMEENLKLLGWTSDKKNFFEGIDIFVLPSLSETFGIVLLEAMIYSTPIITTNSWGPDEIIENEVNGLKFSRNDVKEMPKLLADAIEKLVNNEDFAREIAENSYQDFFKKYTADIVSNRLYEICKKACK